MEYIGKSDGTILFDHSCMVCDKAIEILDDAGITDETIREAVKIAALSHDMGKTMKAYQKYIRLSPENMEKHPYTNDNPRHNEVSAALFRSIINGGKGTPSFRVERNCRISFYYSVIIYFFLQIYLIFLKNQRYLY